MAKTFTKDHLAVELGPNFEYFIREDLEVNSSTFPIGSPLIDTSGNGLLGEAADPVAVGSVVGFAARKGQNGTSKMVSWIIAFPGLLFYANFLATAGATNAVTATDKFAQFDIEMNAVHPVTDDVSGTDMFHVADATAGPTCQMQSFESDQNIAGQTKTAAVAADSDVRVLFQLLDSAIAAVS